MAQVSREDPEPEDFIAEIEAERGPGFAKLVDAAVARRVSLTERAGEVSVTFEANTNAELLALVLQYRAESARVFAVDTPQRTEVDARVGHAQLLEDVEAQLEWAVEKIRALHFRDGGAFERRSAGVLARFREWAGK